MLHHLSRLWRHWSQARKDDTIGVDQLREERLRAFARAARAYRSAPVALCTPEDWDEGSDRDEWQGRGTHGPHVGHPLRLDADGLYCFACARRLRDEEEEEAWPSSRDLMFLDRA